MLEFFEDPDLVIGLLLLFEDMVVAVVYIVDLLLARCGPV